MYGVSNSRPADEEVREAFFQEAARVIGPVARGSYFYSLEGTSSLEYRIHEGCPRSR